MSPAESSREALAPLTLNTPVGAPKKLAPIFTLSARKRSSTTGTPALSICTSTPGASSSSPGPLTPPPRVLGSPVRKRARVRVVSRDLRSGLPRDAAVGDSEDDRDGDDGEEKMDVDVEEPPHTRVSSVTEYFAPSTPSRSREVKRNVVDVDMEPLPAPSAPGARIRRRRIGVAAVRSSAFTTLPVAPSAPTPSLLHTLVHSTIPYAPNTPPSILLLPSLHPPSGRPRDFSPALSVAFNNIAKHYDASTARERGLRRLIAVAGEEGGIRIVDTDEGLGMHREEKGWWWRAHPNAVFDLKWSADDSRMLTASGDHTVRLHALTSPTPTVLATMKGHTSSVKTTVWFDPSGTTADPSSQGVVASSGRDGNILIWDLRCRGRAESVEGLRRSPRETAGGYRAGVPGFAAAGGGSVIEPVMSIKAAHGDGKRSYSLSATRSVTSLVALQSRPGILASGGSFDGIVKLWDLRFPAPTSRNPEPRPTCTPFTSLPDPTISGGGKRARSINSLAENPTTGDLYALCGDSKIHVLRPSVSHDERDRSAIQPYAFTHPDLQVSSFYIKTAISPDGKHIACGSGKAGLIAWDIASRKGIKLGLGEGGVSYARNGEREVSAVDWGYDMVAGCADDLATRIWRSDPDVARRIKDDPEGAGEWMGCA